MSVIGSAGSSGAVYNSGCGGTEDLLSGATVAVDYSVGIAFGCYHPNLLLYFCKRGNLIPIHIISLFVCCLLGVGCSWTWGSIFMRGFEVVAVVVLLVGGIGQSFLNLKRFPGIFLLQVMGCQHELGCFQVVRGCSLKSGKGF